ncbi:hypothetical protein LIER_07145 [Lithospermum erythrorhizon]|uniref:DUF4371 domain-containing protein n=1 Tax=Lithospermum erythrorhizon TaxID=34254 RepID=A0AAV3P7Y5_LITER
MHIFFKTKLRFGDSINAQSEPPLEALISPPIPPSIPNETNQKGIYLESDPTKRQQIINYHPNDQDDNQSIVASLSNYTKKEKSNYLIRLKASFEFVKYLVRGRLAFRAYDKSENLVYKGHFREFVEALGRNCEKNGEAIKNTKGNHKMTSLMIQKDVANACAVETVKKIIDDIGDDIFCVQVDESGDTSDNEQMVVVLRFIDNRGFVVERLIGIVHVEETSAIILKGALETLLSGFGLCIAEIRGQGYDGLTI